MTPGFVLPSHCGDCGVLLMGGATKHREGCWFLKFNREAEEYVRTGIKPAHWDDQPSISCPKCGARSFHPLDIEHHYCGRCHEFHEDAANSPGSPNPPVAENG